MIASLLPLILALQAAAPGATMPPPPGDGAETVGSGPDAVTTPGDAAPGDAAPGDPAPGDIGVVGTTPDDAVGDGRRRPGVAAPALPERIDQTNAGAVRAPPPSAFPTDQIPIPDRWRLIQTLGIVKENLLDPYHQNTLKGDRPIKVPRWLPLHGHDWFLNTSVISDTVVEPRTFPIPVGVQTTSRPGSLDVFGNPHSVVAAQTIIASASLIKGSTAYKPPEIEYRVALAAQGNYVKVHERRILSVKPSKDTDRVDWFIGVQELFVDRHLRNTSDRYDFDSVRVGIQPFQADFRGFLFNDNQLGIRLFGNRDNNRIQYNLFAFWRLEKDTNSGLNDVLQTPRRDYVIGANLYRQDFPLPGFTSQATAIWNINREKNDVQIDDNGFPVRPALLGTLRGRNYDAVYLGLSGDGRLGRVNLTYSAYALLGEDRANIFTGRDSKVRAFFAAAEPSMDFDWIRVRLAGLYATGDGNPRDNKETGFDAIFENPIFAGADTSYKIRQNIPFAGGGRVIAISGRNGILNSLRSSKEEGQSNFINPGTMLLGAGADFDVIPQLRVSVNVNHDWFENTAVLRELRQEGSISRDFGWDYSVATIYRPKMNQNLVFRLSGAMLDAGKGFRDLFDNNRGRKQYYSILFNAILTY